MYPRIRHAIAVLLAGQVLLPAIAFAEENLVAEPDVNGTATETSNSDVESDGRMSTEKAIALFEKRTSDNKKDVMSFVVLGQLYLRHAKENDDLPFYAKAEETFRTALKIKPEQKSAMTFLAITLEARHQFAEALDLATKVAAMSDRETLALATKGDCELHLGQYEKAAKTYKLLRQRENSPAVIARLAHLDELEGRPDVAVQKIQEALAASRTLGFQGSELAWYEMRLGHLLMGQGNLVDSEKHFRAALSHTSNYAAGQMGLAEVMAAQGKLDEAEALYLKAVQEHGEPPGMSGLGDVLARKGDATAAKSWYTKADQKMAEEAATAAAAHYREVAVFYANHDMNPVRAVELAELDLKLRQDVHGYDALAWAFYKNRQFEQALPAIQSALRLGTRDASMHFHAGMIYSALGQTEMAKAELETAIDINPHFSLLYSDVAQTELQRLSRVQ
jgi:tetratricopeptide (TPR) repeat protein